MRYMNPYTPKHKSRHIPTNTAKKRSTIDFFITIVVLFVSGCKVTTYFPNSKIFLATELIVPLCFLAVVVLLFPLLWLPAQVFACRQAALRHLAHR